MVLSDPQVLRAMEHSALESPHYLPIKVKKDGSIADGVASAEQLGKLGRYVDRLLHQIAREIGSGSIDADPVAHGPQDRACQHCDFAAACGTSEAWTRENSGNLWRKKAERRDRHAADAAAGNGRI